MLESKFKLASEKAYNGLDGFEKYKELTDANLDKEVSLIVFMDFSMPIMNGFECAKSIRQYEKDFDLKQSIIIGISAHSTKDYQ